MADVSKIVSLEDAARVIRTVQSAGDRVVLCHGCFDIVHPGHIKYLQHAARQGDRLIVTITGDRLLDKGTNRPLIPQELRAENLAALDCVDWVAINAQPTAVEMLQLLQPDVYVKGQEYEQNADPRFAAERETVERYGGRVVFSSGDVVFSSTVLIAAMEQSADPFQSTLRHLIMQHALAPENVEPTIDSFRKLRVAVIGDCIIDTYVMCDRPDVASESPVMTLRPVEYRSFDGGAAIIARHIAAMGASATLVTALPEHDVGTALQHRLAVEGVRVVAIPTSSKIVEKQRFLVGTSKVMKLDLGQPMTLDAAERRKLRERAREVVSQCDAVILADFGQGLFTSHSLIELCEAIRGHVKIMSGDISGRRSSLLSLRGMDVLCPSESEVRDALHDYDQGLSAVVWNLLHRTDAKAAIITQGHDGLTAFERTADAHLKPEDWRTRLTAEHVPSFVRYPVDQMGCGDALLAAATLTLAAGGSLVRAAVLGNIAAAAEASQLGNAVISASDLRRGLQRLADSHLTVDAQPAISFVRRTHDQLHPAHAQSA